MMQFGADQFITPGIQYARTLKTSNSDDVNNAYWAKSAVTVTTGRSDPYGAATAEGLFETTALGRDFNVGKSAPFSNLSSGTRYLQEAIAKPIGAGRYLLLQSFANSFASAAQVVFDVNDARPGSCYLLGNGGSDFRMSGYDISPFGNGYMRCRMFIDALTSAAFDGCFYNITSSASDNPIRTGDVTKGMDFFHTAFYSVP